MRVDLLVPDTGESADLRRWLLRDPQLRSGVGRERTHEPPADSMGAREELITLLLAPGGLTAALAAAVVAWLQNRRGNQTVTITRPDGVQITVTSERVRGLTPEMSGSLALRVAEAIQAPDTSGPNPAPGSSEPGEPERPPGREQV
ncbi:MULTISPECIES: hypothetical protein [unclassified Streptomyces]|uniref:effector-associated constant component EACC1 n=1 Tax=unclassified Streptomyces TaxID=2593676 RepID=UPI00081E29F0|nr:MULTISPECIES: hypothetical protein [unclassified Streptomyces]SCG07114.1 hypothetical protein GA0115259_110992 [Streptomyces sp. MnatMP-M17]